MTEKNTIPYHELCERHPLPKCTYENGKCVEWDGRRVSVWRETEHPEGDGFRIHIEKALTTGERSLLKFSLTEDAAAALVTLLGDAITSPYQRR